MRDFEKLISLSLFLVILFFGCSGVRIGNVVEPFESSSFNKNKTLVASIEDDPSLLASVVMGEGGVVAPSGFSCTGYEICQDFEASSGCTGASAGPCNEDNSEAWSATQEDSGGYPDFDNAASSLVGLQSLYINTPDYRAKSANSPVVTGSSTKYMYFRIMVTGSGESGEKTGIWDGGTNMCTISWQLGQFDLHSGNNTNGDAYDADVSTEYEVWLDWSSGSKCELRVQTPITGSKPGGADSSMGVIETGSADRCRGIGAGVTNPTTMKIDRILMKPTVIDNVPTT